MEAPLYDRIKVRNWSIAELLKAVRKKMLMGATGSAARRWLIFRYNE
jgi:hypothetical protein